MSKTLKKHIGRQARKRRIRGVVRGTAEHPRLSVFRSLNGISGQVIDDEKGVTLASANDAQIKKGNKMERATEVGKKLAEAAKKAKIKEVVFDRNGYRYHGRIKALADAVREGGLKF